MENMISPLLFTYFAIDCVLLVLSFRLLESTPRVWLICALLIGMMYDNLIVAIGPWFIDSNWYELANRGRFLAHVIFLPFLTLFAWSAMANAGVKLAQSRAGYLACWIFTAIALGWGIYHEVMQLELGPRELAGHIRLVSLSKIPPLATIATNILVLPMAAAVWRRSGWPWFFAGSLFIFVVNGSFATRPWGFLLGNGAEVVFIISLFLTERFLQGIRLPLQPVSAHDP